MVVSGLVECRTCGDVKRVRVLVSLLDAAAAAAADDDDDVYEKGSSTD